MSEDINKHPTIVVEVGEMRADIDVDIAVLIRGMWLAGLKTTMSCQEESDGQVWIEFETTEDLENFVSAVCPREDEDPAMHNRIARSTWDFETWWEYDLFPTDVFSKEIMEFGGDAGKYPEVRPMVVLAPSVRFPRADLPEVERRMIGFNRS